MLQGKAKLLVWHDERAGEEKERGAAKRAAIGELTTLKVKKKTMLQVQRIAGYSETRDRKWSKDRAE